MKEGKEGPAIGGRNAGETRASLSEGRLSILFLFSGMREADVVLFNGGTLEQLERRVFGGGRTFGCLANLS